MLWTLFIGSALILLGALLFLILKRPGKHRIILPGLALALVSVIALLWGGSRLLEVWGLQYRPWLRSMLIGAAGILMAVLEVTAVILCRRWEAVKGAAYGVIALACMFLLVVGGYWSLFLWAFSLEQEETGIWREQKVVMAEIKWLDTRYEYYQYRGPFLMGEYAGASLKPWDEAEW